MENFAPEYYTSFRCIADKCRHSCCMGWEIDIDSETLTYYRSVGGELGERLRNSIAETEDGNAHFILTEDERCPFLNGKGLCDIFIGAGREHLCDICSDHPRFRSFFSSRTEIGLGICCEEAARLVLSQKMPFRLVKLGGTTDNDVPADEKYFFELRETIFSLISDRKIPLIERIRRLEKEFCIRIPERSFDEWVDVLLSFEILDGAWEELLQNSKGDVPRCRYCPPEWELAFEQLLSYFVFRHMYSGIAENNIRSYIAFAVISTDIIAHLFFIFDDISFQKLCEIARMYSSEIEYNEDNTQDMIFEIETAAYL